MHAYPPVCDNKLAHCSHFINEPSMTIPDQRPSNNGKRSPMAGGIFIFIGLLVGVIVGVAQDQASLGMIAGFAGGSALALLLWIFDSFRKQD
jgi:UDP-N-acetylmuramyl pentapeptide phosphotransferase/UDP-N-acetylglucosamine-1-phosphate transferase